MPSTGPPSLLLFSSFLFLLSSFHLSVPGDVLLSSRGKQAPLHNPFTTLRIIPAGSLLARRVEKGCLPMKRLFFTPRPTAGAAPRKRYTKKVALRNRVNTTRPVRHIPRDWWFH